MSTTSIPTSRLTAGASLRLFCLPYAGGGSAVFHRWRSALPLSVDLVPLCLPGHDGRLAEAPRTDVQMLARELADDMMPTLDRPYVLLGHSMGAWIAFELARELRRCNARPPELLVATAARPPGKQLPASPLYLLSDDKLVAAMQSRYDGIPTAILNNAELLELLLPVLRADIQMVETYQCSDEPPFDFNFLMLGGTEDSAVSPAQLADWCRHTARDCSVRQFAGGHFFLFRGDSRQPTTANSNEQTPALRAIVDAISKSLSDS